MTSSWLLALILRSTAVLVATLALGGLLRRGSALARHRLLTLAAMALLALPALPELLPRWDLPFLPAWMGSSPARAAGAPRVAVASREMARASEAAPAPATIGASRPAQWARASDHPWAPTLAGTATVLWLVGVVASLWGLGLGLGRERRVLAASRSLGGEWAETLAEAQRSLSVRGAVRLLVNDDVDTPQTGGWRRPAILLPASASTWTKERQRVVVQHELVHVARADGLRHLAWRLVLAAYWFHPLARLAARRASIAREEACDETVLGLGTRPSAYAGHLLAIAESLTIAPSALVSALPMVDPSQLERRLLVILDPNRSASRGRVLAGLALVVLASMVIGVGAAAPGVVAVLPAAETVVAPSVPGRACTDIGHGTFDGTFTESSSGSDAVGIHNGDFVVQRRLGDGQRLCARAHGPVGFDERDGSILALAPGSWVVVETTGGHDSRRVLVTRDAAEPRYEWWRNGSTQTPDPAGRAWLRDALEAVAGFRQIGAIQGKVGSLQGEIGSIQGEIGSLQGEIGSIQGEEGGLEGKLGSIQGELGGLQGEIGGHQGAIGGLEGGRQRANAAEEARIDREIRSHEAAIDKIEAEIAARHFSARIAAAENDIRTFVDSQAKGRIAEIERRIRDVRADERISQLERQIREMHADERAAEIERRLKPVIERIKHGAE